ncbi:MAG TPA: 7-cyano-7-deazaguanine synthase QueC [Gammaproteobacteria bacterium]|nr:7-cyano-7-deazaguanine synthase QueC [Gammaproteobacteria bacterium]
MPRAVVLLSGGLDSATTLAIARDAGYECHALSCSYGQRHAAELEAAQRVANALGVASHREIEIPIGQFGGSALTDEALAVPEHGGEGIPITYVPARNTILLSLALAWAEVIEADAIFIGVNFVDYSGYPDCRPEFIEAFRRVIALATKRTVEGGEIRLETPLIELSKAEIIRRGAALDVDYSLTVSCYQADDRGFACGRCDACRIRREGFAAARIADPTRYA